MFIGTLFFALYDATGKWLTAGYSVWQILSISRIIPFFIILWIMRGQILNLLSAWRLHFWRSLAVLGTASTFFLSVTYIPLAQAVAICFTAPLFIVLLAGPLLGEKVPSMAWLAMAIGFLGSLLMVRPGFGAFHFASLFAVAASLLYAASILLMRRIPASQGLGSIIFYNTAIMFLAPLPLAAWQWQSPSWKDWATMIGMGGLGFIAQYFINHAYRGGTTARIAPIEYMGLPYGIFFGILIWRDIPTSLDLIGASLILGANLLTSRMKKPEQS